MTQRVLIIGAGHAGGQVAISLRNLGFKGAIKLIGDEPEPPYQRPPLSKEYLIGAMDRDQLFLKGPNYYAEQDISLQLGTRVRTVDLEARTATVDSGSEYPWDALIFATGARPRRLNVSGADLSGVLELRTAHDVERLKPYAMPGKRLVVIGGGYVGLEAAATLTKLGAKVTVVEAGPRVLGRVAGPEISDFFEELHRDAGVEIRVSAQVVSFIGTDGHISGVRMSDDTKLACDAALVGIGVTPNSELAAASGLDCDDGIIVDGRALTSRPDVYAVGDVARRPLPLYERDARLESVHNAIEGAKLAASAIVGAPPPALDVPWFWSNQFEIRLQTAGIALGADQTVVRGAPASRQFAVFYLRRDRLLAVDAINSPVEFVVGKRLIAAGATVTPTDLSDCSVSMKELGTALMR